MMTQKIRNPTKRPRLANVRSTGVRAIVVGLVWLSSIAHAVELESFTQAHRSIDVPSVDMGVLAEVVVEEGQSVREGELLAVVDDRVLQASLAVADAARRATSSRRAADAELVLAEQQLRGYRELATAGNATQRELDRAEAEYWRATLAVASAKEEAEIRNLEYERVTAQIRQRQIVSPLDGVVIRIEKRAGEFVSPTDPTIMRVDRLDVLQVVFSVPIRIAEGLRESQHVRLTLGERRTPASATIEHISPVADPESASIRVRLRIDNADRTRLAGVICRWDLETQTGSLSTANRPRPSTKTETEPRR